MGIVAIIIVLCFFLNEKITPEIPAENWANEKLIWKDRMDGLAEKEILKNVERGKYCNV